MRSILLVLAVSAALSAADTITLRADLYPPFNGDPKAAAPGSIIEIAKVVFEKAGYTIDYQIMPWSRTIDEVKAGKIDGAVGADPVGSAELALPNEGQGYWAPVFCTPTASTWNYDRPDSLTGKTIGIIQDYDYGKDIAGNSYSEWFTAHPQKVQILKGDKPNELAVGMLAKGRLDVFIEDWAVIQAAAAGAQVDPAALRKAGAAGAGYPLYIAFSPNDRGRKLAEILATGTTELRTSGKLAEILTRYHMSDWKK